MEISVVTQQRCQAVDVTGDVKRACKQWGGSGAVLVYCPHTTASVTINENFDPAVMEDVRNWFLKNVPEGDKYAHLEGNADAHIKCLICGNHVAAPVEDGELLTGRWQGILFLEFDGPRHRSLRLTFL